MKINYIDYYEDIDLIHELEDRGYVLVGSKEYSSLREILKEIYLKVCLDKPVERKLYEELFKMTLGVNL